MCYRFIRTLDSEDCGIHEGGEDFAESEFDAVVDFFSDGFSESFHSFVESFFGDPSDESVDTEFLFPFPLPAGGDRAEVFGVIGFT